MNARRLETARAAAAQAADYLAQALWDPHVVTPKGIYDLSLEADTKAGELINEEIGRAFPHEEIFSEEGRENPDRGDYIWYVDPLDGTVNYHHRLPWFCVSISCWRRPPHGEPGWGEPIVSVVAAPLLGQEFWASEGAGAWAVNRGETRRLAVTDAPLEEGILSYSRGSQRDDQEKMKALLAVLGPRARKTRSHGAAALDLAYVAQGSLWAHVQRSLEIWDLAAGIQLIREAGGKVRWQDTPHGKIHVLAGAGDLAELGAATGIP